MLGKATLLGAIAALVWGAFAPALAAAPSPARGAVLAAQGDCAVCHTAPGGASRPYAGGYPLHAIFGTVFSSNITPDPDTGIGRWTADQFYRAMREGIAADGRHLYPAFPYVYFTKMSRQDSDDLFAYLKTIKPERFQPPPNDLIFPANIRWGLTFWNLLYLDKTPWRPDPKHSVQWNRGAQLVEGIGHCGGCHSPKTLLFSDIKSRALQGETIDGWYASNLTGSRHTGLGQWSVDDITSYLKTGRNRFGRAVGGMQDIVRISTSHMSDADRTAIATYIKSFAPGPEQAAETPDAALMQEGQAVYVQNCAVCHSTDTHAYPGLAGNSVVLGEDPTNILHVLMYGSQAVPSVHAPNGYSMPAFGTLDDRQLAAVITYIRNSWGNAAGGISARRVTDLRRLLTPSP